MRMQNMSWLVVVGVLAGLSAAPLAAQYSSGSSSWSGSTEGCGDRSRWSTGDWRGSRLRVIGLTADQRLICFDENQPDGAENLGSIVGFTGDSKLVGIDYRPAKSVLYGLGDAGGVYTIDPATAQATLVSRLNVPLNGTSFGVDFNPVVDRLRVISDRGQNLRVNVETGATIADATLTYTPGTAATGVTGAAYTNNDTDANTATTLYDIDSLLDQVAIQSPANAGTLSATGKLTADTTAGVGFDIYSTIRNGTTVDVQALAALRVGGQARLYKITLFSGKAILRGAFAAQDQVIGIAIPLNQL